MPSTTGRERHRPRTVSEQKKRKQSSKKGAQPGAKKGAIQSVLGWGKEKKRPLAEGRRGILEKKYGSKKARKKNKKKKVFWPLKGGQFVRSDRRQKAGSGDAGGKSRNGKVGVH